MISSPAQRGIIMIETDVLVIGAGPAGSSAARFAAKEGVDVIIIDKSTIASGTTKNTTAKITAQHNLIYDKLLKTIGYNKTKLF